MPCGCTKNKVAPVEQQRAAPKTMPLTLVDLHTTPHGGFNYFEARTRTRLTAPTAHYLADLVIKHREANRIETGTMDTVLMEIQEQLCQTAPPGVCRDKEGQVKMSGTAINWDSISRAASTLKDRFFKHGKEKVSVEAATERARVCGNCFANKKPEGCTACASAWLRELVEWAAKDGETPHDPLIHTCAYCGCQLKALIWMPIEVLREHTPPEELQALPEFCWKKKEIS